MSKEKEASSKELKNNEEHIVYKRVTDPNAVLRKATLILTFGVIFAAFVVATYYNKLITPPNSLPVNQFDSKVEQFASVQEFQEYLSNAASLQTDSYGYSAQTFRATEDLALSPSNAPAGESALKTSPDRVSETYVQVPGVDEPDILKTNGGKIFFSRQPQSYYPTPLLDVGVDFEESDRVSSVPRYITGETKILNSFPLDQLAEDGSIDLDGNLLLYEDTLMILRSNNVVAYDVTDTTNPEKKWEYEYDGSYLQNARLLDGKLYLILTRSVDRTSPCPIPLATGLRNVEVACTDIYHPIQVTNTDTTYNILKVDAEKGSVEKTTSFLGSAYSSVVYMSTNNLYVTFPLQTDYASFYYNFFLKSGVDLIPTSVLERIQKLSTYDISARAKFTELNIILEQYKTTLDVDNQIKFESELINKLQSYTKDHAREVEATGIVKLQLDSMDVEAHGSVAGRLLNQFSLDEYDRHLRVASTIGSSILTPTESFSEIYVLDKNLDETGSIKQLAFDERIYAVRFLGDKGYVVTFKQIDPFFVLDLSDHKNPKVTGELKIPGFSSLLHPLPNDLVLGIGQESRFVKLSLFDVSNPNDPKEVSKYLLDETWSEVSNNHHAFLPDEKYNAFFIPGGKGAYIFEYLNNTLSLVKTVSEEQVKRALYIEDFMYILSNQKLIAIDERDWSTVSELSFD